MTGASHERCAMMLNMGRLPTVFVSIGQRYGRGVVISDEIRIHVSDKRPEGYRAVICICDCGEEYTPQISDLVNGKSTSCGCFRREQAAVHCRENYTVHGLRDHPHYSRVNNAIRRCNDENNPAFCNYGARGIGVYPPWEDDISLFIDYLDSLGPCPDGWSMDRKDNELDYQPGNIRWASAIDQANNRRPRQCFRKPG
jgi:hypothetical protein